MPWLQNSSAAIIQHLPACVPRLGIILGSGWADALDGLVVTGYFDLSTLPGSPCSAVAGHPNRVAIIRHAGVDVVVFIGRRHWYEGSGWEPVALPVYVMKQLGVPSVLLTNAGGGIAATWKPGNLTIINDHVNAMGVNPLVGPADPFWGPRFPDMSAIYDPRLRRALVLAGRRNRIPMRHGVYAAVSGPAYETPAEIAVLRKAGADAVGMSTVPEAILAHAAGMRVAGLSLIANLAAGARRKPLAHDDVLLASRRVIPLLKQLLPSFIESAAALG